MSDVLLNRVELMHKLDEIIRTATNDPVEEIAALGKALTEIAKALKGQSPAEVKAILSAVQALQ